ncbi:MAG: rhamnogalacturonan acetylesterase [Marinagarivorans sp.]|nr:rhamnogalacturonan acetylesterase [Marinagarivorans sp.]
MSLFRVKKTALALMALFTLSACSITPQPSVVQTHIYMAGDSTMSVKELKDYPETGWGMPFAYFFNDTITVDNRAMNGRSTRTFIEEARWESIMKTLTAGDFVFIQFGHNDESEQKVDRYTTPVEYKQNLLRFINDVRAAKAEPILLSPITRRSFNASGVIAPTHPYAPLSVEVAKESGVTFIDMEKITRAYFQSMGDKDSAMRFNHILANTHPNYPNGVRDNTHLNELGAREVAQLVLTELKKINHPLSNRLRSVDPKHLTLSY